MNGEEPKVDGRRLDKVVSRAEREHSVLPFTVYGQSPVSSKVGHCSPITGFTLIELMVVMSIIALLMALAMPRYFHGTDRAREAVLREDLLQMRRAIDQYRADRGKYPEHLDELVGANYLRSIPADPITESNATWIVIPAPPPATGTISDVRSGATGVAADGVKYGDW